MEGFGDMTLTFNTLIADVSVALRAINFYQSGSYKDAIGDLQSILDYEPCNWDARLMLAACFYKTGQLPAAHRAFSFIKDRCDKDDVRNRAMEGLEATNAKLEKRDTSMSALPAEYGLYVERVNAPSQQRGPSWLL